MAPIILIGGLLTAQILQFIILTFLYKKVYEHASHIFELKAKPIIKLAAFKDHIECSQCHSIVARYNPETGLCANCDHEGFIKSRQ